MKSRLVVVLVCGLALVACGSDDEPAPGLVRVNPAPAGQPWATLAEWRLFADGRQAKPAERVVPFDVISPLWSDDTVKERYLYVPEGETIGYEDTARWKFPVGTILVKTFAYPIDARDLSLGRRLLETRLLVHEASGWTAHTYVFDETESSTSYTIAGATLEAAWIDEAGESRTHAYKVPDLNQCAQCHGLSAPDTLGGVTRQLDRDNDYGGGSKNQLDHFAELGLLPGLPPASERERLTSPTGSAAVTLRARSYLDANCAHCHAEGGQAAQSGLLLGWLSTAVGPDVNWGVCKVPTSAGGATCGLSHDIVPGEPDKSVLVCRMESRVPSIQMPTLGTGLVDHAGVAVIREWIAGLEPTGCQ